MELKGSIADFPLPDIVQLIGSARRTGLLLVTVGGNRASVYFEGGDIVHAEYRELAGQAVLNRLLLEPGGSFQFLADAQPKERNWSSDWMSAVMEAVRVSDELGRGAEGDGLDGLFDENPGASPAAPTSQPPRPAWDGAGVKARLRETLREAFGRKAAKLEQELEKCPETKLDLLDFCTKAEKYIYVFLDSGRSRSAADRLRSVVEGNPP